MMNLLQIIKDEDIDIYYIDLFAGAGGTSTGVEKAMVNGKKVARVIVCVNHDINAIASHFANHPHAMHFTEDIRTLDLSLIASLVKKIRMMKPDAKIVLWASLECTNFSKAKGGLPRDADSRTLAEHLYRYIEAIHPDYIQIENVEEFMAWGDVDENGKPLSMKKGCSYQRWIHTVKKYGYDYDYRILNAADYGAYTSRRRYFGIFAKDGLPVAFPEPTHAKNPPKGDLFGTKLKKWKAVKDVLDFSDEGESIFDRKKPLVEATLDRVLSGLIKFVAGGKDKWLLKYNSVNGKTGKHVPPSIEEPCPVVSVQGRIGIVQAKFIQQRNSGNPNSKVFGVDQPARTVTSTGGNMELVQAKRFIAKYYSGRPDGKVISVDGPAGAITTVDGHSLVTGKFLSAYYGNGFNSSVDDPSPVVPTKDRLSLINPRFLISYNYKDEPKDMESPCPTLLTKDRFALTLPIFFIDQQFGQSKAAEIDAPLGALTANPKYNLVRCNRWLMNTNFGNVGSSLDEPAPVITANRKWHYLMDAQYSRIGRSIDQPCFTLIARMDKTPPYLVEASSTMDNIPSFIKIHGNVVIYEIYETDSQKTKEIKEFMAIYGLSDVLMRMLRIPELKQIMGFPKDYTLIGTQAEQKKYIGNAVEVNMAMFMCAAMVIKIHQMDSQKLKNAI
ncbi:MAG: DNA cytosine methyltransferase [Bacteroidales bacterium]|nr:DNA cytosine methyltransferase [Bacteroidales bacterium]